MDSGNSASMQSSSGGDEEYDSRPDSIMAAFLTHAGSFAGNFHPPPLSTSQSSSPPVFDHLSTLFDPRSSLSNQNPLLNFDIPWSRTDKSDRIQPDLPDPPPNSAANPDHDLSSISNFSAAVHNFSHPPPGIPNSFPPNSDQTDAQNVPNNVGRGGGGGLHPKKRPRASRRAPTTVLTTNTTNFRAMVQEFTGIPAPPFTAASSSSSPFTRTAAKFDLFGGGRKATHLDVVPSTQTQLMRPFPQKPAVNSQNPIFNMFQSNPKFIPSFNDQNFKMGVFEEFGLSSHGQGLQSTVNNNQSPASWIGGGGGGGDQSNQQGVNLRSGHGNINGKFIRYATGTVNSSGFYGNKVAEDLRVREGMVEPWICSSD